MSWTPTGSPSLSITGTGEPRQPERVGYVHSVSLPPGRMASPSTGPNAPREGGATSGATGHSAAPWRSSHASASASSARGWRRPPGRARARADSRAARRRSRGSAARARPRAPRCRGQPDRRLGREHHVEGAAHRGLPGRGAPRRRRGPRRPAPPPPADRCAAGRAHRLQSVLLEHRDRGRRAHGGFQRCQHREGQLEVVDAAGHRPDAAHHPRPRAADQGVVVGPTAPCRVRAFRPNSPQK
jgi:hypothetical protein